MTQVFRLHADINNVDYLPTQLPNQHEIHIYINGHSALLRLVDRLCQHGW